MRARWAAGLLALIVLAGGTAWADRPGHASKPEQPVDDDFLEFLGSVDSESSPGEAWWIDYLSRSDPGRTKPPGGNPPPKPTVPARPANPGDTQKSG
jgi:hypothetical protein